MKSIVPATDVAKTTRGLFHSSLRCWILYGICFCAGIQWWL